MVKSVVIFLFYYFFSTILLAQSIAPVKVIKVNYGTISEIVEGHGIIKPLPQNDIRISSVSPIKILNIYVKPGDAIKKGQPVIKLQRDHSIDLAVQKAKINLSQAKIILDRMKKLYKAGVVAKVKLEAAQTNYALANSEYKLQQQSQKYAILNSAITSPINGVVSSINGIIGQVADPTMELVHIVNMKNPIASIGIESEDMNNVKVGQQAEVTIPNITNDKTFIGTVIKQNKEIDPSTQLIHIWIGIKNPSNKLQPGMFAEAKINIKTDRNALVLPRSAVLKDKGGSYIFIIKNNKAKKVYVKKGIENADYVEIIRGLTKGESVVYLGNYELKDGMQVEIQQ